MFIWDIVTSPKDSDSSMFEKRNGKSKGEELQVIK